MKGLLKKDLALLANTGKSYVGVLLFCMVLGLVNGEMKQFSLGFLVMMLSLAALSTFSYDEFDNSMAFLMVLPVSRKMYVLEKYLFGGMLGFGGFAAALILFLISEKNNASSMTFTQYVLLILCFLAFIVLFLSLMIPVQLKFGSEKGRIVLFIIFFGIIGIVYLLSRLTKKIPAQVLNFFQEIPQLPFWLLTALAIGIYFLAIFISLKISLKIMEKKEW